MRTRYQVDLAGRALQYYAPFRRPFSSGQKSARQRGENGPCFILLTRNGEQHGGRHEGLPCLVMLLSVPFSVFPRDGSRHGTGLKLALLRFRANWNKERQGSKSTPFLAENGGRHGTKVITGIYPSSLLPSAGWNELFTQKYAINGFFCSNFIPGIAAIISKFGS